jgi:hypothetical protein
VTTLFRASHAYHHPDHLYHADRHRRGARSLQPHQGDLDRFFGRVRDLRARAFDLEVLPRPLARSVARFFNRARDDIRQSAALAQVLKGSQFLCFTFFYALMQGAGVIASPFFTVYMLRDLRFTYLQFMAAAAMTVVMQFLMVNTWGCISDVFGNRLVL